jgi:hypothetical protein
VGKPARQRVDPPRASWWATVRYAIDSTPRTVRLIAILIFTPGIPSAMVFLILHH